MTTTRVYRKTKLERDGSALPIPSSMARLSTSRTASSLHAARRFAAERHRRLDRRVFITGFSQGGAAAIALAREFQRPGHGQRVAALAPISGPYDLRHAEIPAVLAGRSNRAISPPMSPTSAQPAIARTTSSRRLADAFPRTV
jgi:dienelactone hydrolase